MVENLITLGIVLAALRLVCYNWRCGLDVCGLCIRCLGGGMQPGNVHCWGQSTVWWDLTGQDKKDQKTRPILQDGFRRLARPAFGTLVRMRGTCTGNDGDNPGEHTQTLPERFDHVASEPSRLHTPYQRSRH
ncbi:hypothetical protein B0H65DRAFT_443801 [Neurospora tetraspora]|uniref:Secreted protein n=1 Tax=Neurospora tetraspora TaxID=94610 RepID=A0AAE0MR38_9PEZI|nr:hypothetical protein B0H65DRAFT_443801 [Neurospora tetraspora]